jgi:hypothetical protein
VIRTKRTSISVNNTWQVCFQPPNADIFLIGTKTMVEPQLRQGRGEFVISRQTAGAALCFDGGVTSSHSLSPN